MQAALLLAQEQLCMRAGGDWQSQSTEVASGSHSQRIDLPACHHLLLVYPATCLLSCSMAAIGAPTCARSMWKPRAIKRDTWDAIRDPLASGPLVTPSTLAKMHQHQLWTAHSHVCLHAKWVLKCCHWALPASSTDCHRLPWCSASRPVAWRIRSGCHATGNSQFPSEPKAAIGEILAACNHAGSVALSFWTMRGTCSLAVLHLQISGRCLCPSHRLFGYLASRSWLVSRWPLSGSSAASS